MHSEASDLIGSVRPTRRRLVSNSERAPTNEDVRQDSAASPAPLFEWQNGPLLDALLEPSGALFLIDEIALADDSVLERLNSLLGLQFKVKSSSDLSIK